MVKKLFLLTVSAMLPALLSCASAAPEERSAGPLRNSYYAFLSFDSHGMPAFSERLPERPGRRGEDFFLVEEDGSGRSLKYYHLFIKGGEADMRKPFRTVMKRTAGGIKGGTMFALEILQSSNTSTNKEAEAALAFAAISVAVGTIGGISVGLVEGTYEAVQEAGKSFSSMEELLSFSSCEYDGRGRLLTLRAFEPGEPGVRAREIFRVRYSYDDGFEAPSSITVEDVRP